MDLRSWGSQLATKPLSWLQQEGDEHMVKLLLEVDIDINSVISGSWNHPPFWWLPKRIRVPSGAVLASRLSCWTFPTCTLAHLPSLLRCLLRQKTPRQRHRLRERESTRCILLRVIPLHLEYLPRRPRGLGPSSKTNLERPSNRLWQGSLWKPPNGKAVMPCSV